MKRCADQVDCGYENRDSDLFCRACALPLLNTALAGRYKILALISKGGYAAVFHGIDQHLSRRIAIKVLLPSKTTPTEHEHFLREARIAATLDHPNIAPVLDYGKDGPSVFLVMPLYTAGSMRTRLAQADGPLPANETMNNFRQLCTALHYAHTRPRPVIHRDIKPENILIHQEDARLVITDFGIARALEPGVSVGKTITVRGTVGYMAPEQVNGIVDPRSDQYGSGVVLYEMLTGYHPLDPLGSAIPYPSTLNRELPSALDAVVLRGLATRPEERYTNMLEFLQAFDLACRPTAPTRPDNAAARATARVAPIHRKEAAPIRPANDAESSSEAQAGRKESAKMRVLPGNTPPPVSSLQGRAMSSSSLPAVQGGGKSAPSRPANDAMPSHYLSPREGAERVVSSQAQAGRQEYDNSGRHASVKPQSTTSSVREKCLEGDELRKQQRYSQALQAYEEALRMDPLNFYAWNGKGTTLYNQGNYKKALEAYSRATEIDPSNPIVWVSAGLALNRLQRYQQALVHFERALSLAPQYVQAWNGKADAQLDMNMPEEAHASYEQALVYDANSFQAWNGLGNARSSLRDFQGAVEAYTRALHVNPHSAVAWCNKAEALIRMGHNRAALDALHEATEMDRSYGRAWALKADVYEALGNPQEAQKARRRAKPWGSMN